MFSIFPEKIYKQLRKLRFQSLFEVVQLNLEKGVNDSNYGRDGEILNSQKIKTISIPSRIILIIEINFKVAQVRLELNTHFAWILAHVGHRLLL